MSCIAGIISQNFGYFFSYLPFIIMTLVAVDRWLHTSQRSLLTALRVVILYFTFVVSAVLVVVTRSRKVSYVSVALFLVIAAICVVVTAFSYFKVFQIIRHHQRQVQTNETAINMRKYKKSIFTILYILAVFVLSFIPLVISFASLHVFFILRHYDLAVWNACAAVVFSCSFVNP